MMPSGAVLELAPNDQALADVEALCFTRPWTAGDFAAFRRNPNVQAWGLRRGDQPLEAFLLFQLLPGEGELLRIGSAPASRRGGWARGLLQQWRDHCVERGAERLFLEVRAGNTPAVNLFTSVGFSQIATREGYYSHPLEDALVFQHQAGGGANP